MKEVQNQPAANPQHGIPAGIRCPKCGGPTFTANIDLIDQILCMDEACKWKALLYPNSCSMNVSGLCTTSDPCQYKILLQGCCYPCGQRVKCGLEAAALKDAATYQKRGE